MTDKIIPIPTLIVANNIAQWNKKIFIIIINLLKFRVFPICFFGLRFFKDLVKQLLQDSKSPIVSI
ncbi:MAG: hypothetical protein BWK78_03265 [Thiotrichaceae bacterium IS1]|nr:MAG: hypothetical protein BWK78_03265 [Thiotrichaceae bacterium IS1]